MRLNMDFKFLLTTLILVIVIITTISVLTLSAVISITALAKRSNDLLSFYIHNMRYTLICAVMYVSFFILFLYGLRLWNINHTLDLRMLYSSSVLFFQLSSWTTCTLSILFGFFIVINILLFIIRLHKYCLHHIYILYLYLHYHEHNSSLPDVKWVFRKISEPFNKDIIVYSIQQLLFKLNRYLLKVRYFNGIAWYSPRVKIPWYFIYYHVYKFVIKVSCNKYYEKFITFSPIFVILYDCVFNNFILSHLYYYLLVYTPLILLRKISSCIFQDAPYICELLCNIYYKKETCIYAISYKQKKLLDLYITSELRSNVNLGLEAEMYLKNELCFTPDDNNSDHSYYYNNEGVILKRTLENKLIRNNLDEDLISEEWVLLVDKHHFINNDKYKTLVFIN